MNFFFFLKELTEDLNLSRENLHLASKILHLDTLSY